MAEKKNQVASKAATDSGRYRLFKSYKEEIVPALMKERGYTNVNEVPALEKIVVNMRMGDIKDNSKSVSAAIKELEAICGQKALVTKAKKSVANFKLREGQAVGAKVTLRGLRMYEFFDKLVSIALPRRPRLPRNFRKVLRRTRKLRAWGKGAYHFPRSILRADRKGARVRRMCRYHRQIRR